MYFPENGRKEDEERIGRQGPVQKGRYTHENCSAYG